MQTQVHSQDACDRFGVPEAGRPCRIWLVARATPLAVDTLGLLRGRGFEALAMERAADALFMHASARPEAIVLDCSVPDGGGLASVVSAFRAALHLAGVPILLYSSEPWPDPEVFHERALAAGGLPLRRFPLDAAELLDLLAELLDPSAVSSAGTA